MINILFLLLLFINAFSCWNPSVTTLARPVWP
jgi:hypothetical protein